MLKGGMNCISLRVSEKVGNIKPISFVTNFPSCGKYESLDSCEVVIWKLILSYGIHFRLTMYIYIYRRTIPWWYYFHCSWLSNSFKVAKISLDRVKDFLLVSGHLKLSNSFGKVSVTYSKQIRAELRLLLTRLAYDVDVSDCLVT